MKRTLLVLSALALLAIVTNAVVIQTLPSGAILTLSLPAHEAVYYAPATIEALVVAACVFALVLMAQRRQWSWFTGIFILLLISVYRDLVLFTLAYVGLNRVLGNFLFSVPDGVVLGLAPLATLVYSLVGTQAKPPATAA